MIWPSPFCIVCLRLPCSSELEACTKANEELHKLREAAEAREATTEEKLRLEHQVRQGMIRKSHTY